MRTVALFVPLAFLMAISVTVAKVHALTLPYYSYAEVFSERGFVSQDGVADPGPYGDYSSAEDESSGPLFVAHGYRWWGYCGECIMPCIPRYRFDFPWPHGYHPCDPNIGCINPPIGWMASWGGIIADPEGGTITSLVGAWHHGGPTQQYCVPNPFGPGEICYGIPSTWGFGAAYGYIRQVVRVESDGTLQAGDPVEIEASISVQGSVTPVLFLTKLENVTWLEWAEYLTWGAVEDMLGTPYVLDAMLGYIGPRSSRSLLRGKREMAESIGCSRRTTSQTPTGPT